MMVRYFLFSQGSILLRRLADGRYALPCGEEWPVKPEGGMAVPLPSFDETPCEGMMVDAWPDVLPEGYATPTLREAFALLPFSDYGLAGKAEELLHWHGLSRYCGACGGELQRATTISKRCPSCGREYWPTISPAVIVLIMRDDDHILLVRSNSIRGRYYGLVAGFVETGESLEECLMREVAEETGLSVTDVRYFGSQPWPYPNNLMVGYTARYAGGQLTCRDGELTEAAWFSRDCLPAIPSPPSMARMLIEAWRNRRLPGL